MIALTDTVPQMRAGMQTRKGAEIGVAATAEVPAGQGLTVGAEVAATTDTVMIGQEIAVAHRLHTERSLLVDGVEDDENLVYRVYS